MSVSMVNMSTRLESNLHKVVTDLKEQGKLSVILKLLLSALENNRSATLSFLLGLGDSSVSSNRLQTSVVKANLYEKYLSLGIEKSFKDWVSELDEVELNFNSGMVVSKIDAYDTLSKVLDDLDLEIVPKGSVSTSDSDGVVDLGSLESIIRSVMVDVLGQGVNVSSPVSVGGDSISDGGSSSGSSVGSSSDGVVSSSAGGSVVSSDVEDTVSLGITGDAVSSTEDSGVSNVDNTLEFMGSLL